MICMYILGRTFFSWIAKLSMRTSLVKFCSSFERSDWHASPPGFQVNKSRIVLRMCRICIGCDCQLWVFISDVDRTENGNSFVSGRIRSRVVLRVLVSERNFGRVDGGWDSGSGGVEGVDQIFAWPLRTSAGEREYRKVSRCRWVVGDRFHFAVRGLLICVNAIREENEIDRSGEEKVWVSCRAVSKETVPEDVARSRGLIGLVITPRRKWIFRYSFVFRMFG